MSFKDLDMNEMVSLFSPLVNDPAMKSTFLSIPEIAGLYSKVTSAYELVVSVRRARDSLDPDVVEISTQQGVMDDRHDHLARCGALLVEARRELALADDPPDEATATACGDALTAILPDGTSIINASYRAEAGNTERLAHLLEKPESAQTRALLTSIPVREGETALGVVSRWIQAGADLGQLEAKKAGRLAVLKNEPAPPQRVIQGARSQWIKVASLVVQAAQLSDAPVEAKAAIIDPILTAAERAGVRAARRAAKTAPPDGVPTPTGKA